MTIGQLSKKIDLTPQTIRYYESLKLIPKPDCTYAGYRRYTKDYIEKLNFIKNAKELGFTLKEIKSIIKVDNCEDTYELSLKKLNETEMKLIYYKQLQKKIKKLILLCPQNGSLENCSIMKSLNQNN